MMVRLVQPGSLNRHVDDSIPLTWAKRWSGLRVGLPIIVFSCAVYLPVLTVVALLERSWEPIQRAMIPLVCLPPFLLLVWEFSIRVQHKFKRVLELRDHRVAFQAGRHKNWVKWRDIMAVRFEPIPETTEHCVTLVETKSRKGKTGRPWALVLPWDDVKSVLVPELNRRMSENRSAFEIEFRERRTEVQAKPRLPMLWFFALGLFLLVHGMPLLAVGLIGLSESTEERREKRETGKSAAKVKLS